MEQEVLNVNDNIRVIVSLAFIVTAYLVDFLCCRLLIPGSSGK